MRSDLYLHMTRFYHADPRQPASEAFLWNVVDPTVSIPTSDLLLKTLNGPRSPFLFAHQAVEDELYDIAEAME